MLTITLLQLAENNSPPCSWWSASRRRPLRAVSRPVLSVWPRRCVWDRRRFSARHWASRRRIWDVSAVGRSPFVSFGTLADSSPRASGSVEGWDVSSPSSCESRRRARRDHRSGRLSPAYFSRRHVLWRRASPGSERWGWDEKWSERELPWPSSALTSLPSIARRILWRTRDCSDKPRWTSDEWSPSPGQCAGSSSLLCPHEWVSDCFKELTLGEVLNHRSSETLLRWFFSERGENRFQLVRSVQSGHFTRREKTVDDLHERRIDKLIIFHQKNALFTFHTSTLQDLRGSRTSDQHDRSAIGFTVFKSFLNCFSP